MYDIKRRISVVIEYNYKTSEKLFAKCKRNEIVQGVSPDKSLLNY